MLNRHGGCVLSQGREEVGGKNYSLRHLTSRGKTVGAETCPHNSVTKICDSDLLSLMSQTIAAKGN